MSRYRDFDAAQQERAAEPLRFKLGGIIFEMPGFVPASSLLSLARLSELTGSAAVEAFGEFLKAGIPVAEHPALDEALHKVDFTALVEVVRWIIEETTGRPLESLPGSVLPPSTNGDSSRIDWRNGESIPSP